MAPAAVTTSWRAEWLTWVIAFVVACGLYFFVSRGQPQGVETRAIDLAIKPSSRVAVANALPSEVNMKVEGAIDSVKAFLDSEPVAELDLANALEGSGQEIRLLVKPQPTLGLVKVTLNPASLLVDLEPRATRTLIPKMLSTGELREYLTLDQEIEGLPQSVQVTGPERRMNEVADIIFRVDLSQFEGVAQRLVTFQAVDLAGIKVPFVQIEPAEAEVRFLVHRKQESVRVPVLPSLQGAPAPGYLLFNLDVEPPTVEMSGAGRELARIRQAETEIIDITGISTDQTYTRKVTLRHGSGITLSPATVTVKVQVERISGRRTIPAVAVELTDRQPGKTYRLEPAAIQVTLQGDPTALRELAETMVRARLRVGAFPVGAHPIRLDAIELDYPPGLSLLGRSPEALNLVVEEGP